MNTFEKIYQVVRRIPYGKVASYGQIAAAVGNPRLTRVVGYALHRNPAPGVIPCHRVVKKDGSVSEAFAFGGENAQIEMLRAEGVEFAEYGKVDMLHFQWTETWVAVFD